MKTILCVTIDPAAIDRARVEMTVFDGKIVFEAR